MKWNFFDWMSKEKINSSEKCSQNNIILDEIPYGLNKKYIKKWLKVIYDRNEISL
jgi:hypothetical protein